MKISALVVAVAALASFVSAAPTTKPDSTALKPAFTGTLVSYSASVALGGSLDIAYGASAQSAEPHYPASIRSVDIGLQGPAPIVPSANSFTPFEILELANGLETGGPGGWVNESLRVPGTVYQSGEYFLIVTEHQLAVYDSEAPVYRVQSYNVSVQVRAA